MTLISLTDFFGDYGFRIMFIGTTLVGLFAGLVGALLYLQKQSLVSDVIGHSAISGVLVAFIVAAGVLGLDGRSMIVVTLGAAAASLLAVLLSNWIADNTPVGIDAAMAVAMAIFYGGGMVLMNLVNASTLPGRAGVSSYLFGNAATMRRDDVIIIAIFGLACVIAFVAAYHPIKMYLFERTSAELAGFSSRVLQPLILGICTIAIVIGIKAVGMILMVAFAILPAAAARQWARSFGVMVMLSAAFGAIGGGLGSYLAVSIGKVPTGPVVVICLFVIFVISMVAVPDRSLIVRAVRRRSLAKQAAAPNSVRPVHEVR